MSSVKAANYKFFTRLSDTEIVYFTGQGHSLMHIRSLGDH